MNVEPITLEKSEEVAARVCQLHAQLLSPINPVGCKLDPSNPVSGNADLMDLDVASKGALPA